MDDTYHRDRSDAWGAVCEALNAARPCWWELAPRGMDAAVAAITELAVRKSLKSKGEAK